MKRNFFALILISAVCTAALATKPKPTPTPPQPGNASAVSTAQASAIAAAAALAVQKQFQAQAQQQHQNAQAISGGNTVTSTTTVQAQNRDPVGTAFAAALTAANGTCMGSTSAGAQGVTIGLSVGTTWKSDNCDRRYNSIRMQELGQTKAAIALMCQDTNVAEAMEKAGTPCPSAPAGPASTKTACAAYTGSDPIVKSRQCGE